MFSAMTNMGAGLEGNNYGFEDEQDHNEYGNN